MSVGQLSERPDEALACIAQRPNRHATGRIVARHRQGNSVVNWVTATSAEVCDLACGRPMVQCSNREGQTG